MPVGICWCSFFYTPGSHASAHWPGNEDPGGTKVTLFNIIIFIRFDGLGMALLWLSYGVGMAEIWSLHVAKIATVSS